jgi:hypothetical protein
MYCPVDGDEFVEGKTRCPEHNVDLVPERPDWLDEESRSLLARWDRDTAFRWAFKVLILAALIYGLGGLVHGVLYSLMFSKPQSNFSDVLIYSQQVTGAAFAVGLASLGVLAGALVLEGLTRLRSDGSEARHPTERRLPRGFIHRGPDLLMFWIFVVFAVVWMTTGVWASIEQGSPYPQTRFLGGGGEQPTDLYIDLLSIRFAAFTIAVASFTLLASRLIIRAYQRLSGAPVTSGSIEEPVSETNT